MTSPLIQPVVWREIKAGETLGAYIFKGDLVRGKGLVLSELGINTIENFAKEDAGRQAAKKPGVFPLNTPELRLLPGKSFHVITLNENFSKAAAKWKETDKLPQLTDKLQEYVTKYFEDKAVAPGPFGDFAQIIKISDDKAAVQIMRKAFPKPAEASDACVVFKHRGVKGNQRYQLFTGVRKKDPGAGKNAWLGGFNDVGIVQELEKIGKAEVFDSPVYTALKELLEESADSMQVGLSKEEWGKLREKYTLDEPIKTTVTFPQGGGKDGQEKVTFPATISSLGRIATSNAPLSRKKGGPLVIRAGERLSDGSKRVHTTSGIYIEIEASESFTTDLGGRELVQHLGIKTGDDVAKDTGRFHDITDAISSGDTEKASQNIKFGIKHHAVFLKKIVKNLHAKELEAAKKSAQEKAVEKVGLTGGNTRTKTKTKAKTLPKKRGFFSKLWSGFVTRLKKFFNMISFGRLFRKEKKKKV